MTNNELITELLKYDGWGITETNTVTRYRLFVGYELIKGCHLCNHLELSTEPMLHAYLTDMNIIHRIAVKVVRELFTTISDTDDFNEGMEMQDVKEGIYRGIFSPPTHKANTYNWQQH